jgi:thioredoxin 1
MSDIVVTDQNFEAEVLKSQVPVVVDFWAPWCAPCRIVGPIIEELAKEFAGKVKVGKMNVDDNTQTAGTYGIMSIPTVMVFKNGTPLKSLVGAQSKDTYKNAVNEALAA